IWTFSLRNHSVVRRRLVAATVTLPLSADPDAACAALRSAVDSAPFVIASPAPRVLVEGVGGDGYQLNMLFWVDDAAIGTAIESLYGLVDKGLAADGIALDTPFGLNRTLPSPNTPSLYRDLMRTPR